MANHDPREDRDPLGDLRFARFVQAQHAREERVGRFRAEEAFRKAAGQTRPSLLRRLVERIKGRAAQRPPTKRW